MSRLSPADWLALTSLVATTSGLMAAPLISPFVTKELGVNASLAGLIVAATSLTSLLTKIPISIYVSTRDIQYWLLLSLGLNAVCLVGYYVSQDYYVFSAFRLVNGIALALEFTTMLTLSGLSAKSEAEMASSVQKYTATTAMGLALGPLLGTAPVALVGFRNTFVVAAILGVVAIIPAFIHQRKTQGLWVGFSSSKFTGNDLRNLMSVNEFKLGTATYLSFAFFAGVLFAYGPLIVLLQYNLPEYWVTLMFFVYFLMSTIVRFSLRRIMGFLGLVRLLALGLIAPVLALIMFSLPPTSILLPIGFVLGGVGHGIVFPLTALVVSRAVPPDQKFAANSLYLTAFDLGFLIGPTYASLLVLSLGIPRTVLLVAIGPVLGLLAVAGLPKE